MKPLGPIPAGFGAIDGELAIAGVPASDAGRARGRHAAVRLFGRDDPRAGRGAARGDAGAAGTFIMP